MTYKKLCGSTVAGLLLSTLSFAPMSVAAVVPNWQPDQWYDLDGDGTFEFIQGSRFYTNPFSPKLLFSLPSNCDTKINSIQLEKLPGENAVLFRHPNTVAGIIKNNTYRALDIPKPTNYYYYIADYANSGRKGVMSWVDINGNGFTGRVHNVNSSGVVATDKYDIYSWNEYHGIKSDLTLSSGGEGIPGMEDMFGRDGGGSSISGFISVDINGDGIPDLFDGSGGYYYLNSGLNGYVRGGFSGKTEMRDLNNDGIADFVTYNASDKTVSVSITRPNDTPVTSQLLKGYSVGDFIWCYDFDRDGDVDVLVPVADSAGAFLIFYQNDGTGRFKQFENWLDGPMTVVQCQDIDADGYYEVIAIADNKTTSKSEVRVYRVKGKEIADEYTILPADIEVPKLNNNYHITFINADHSGVPAVALGYYYSGSIFAKLNVLANKRPQAPANVSFTNMPSSNTLKVYWSAGSDAETPEVDLTYEVMVGSAPGLDDIVSANALPDGRRRNQLQGSNGHIRYRTFDTSSWPKGKCYISVQTVDQNKLGSTFSTPVVFEKQSYPVAFSIEGDDTYAVGDEVTLRVVGNVNPSANYTWGTGDATVIETSADKSAVKIRLTSGGKKTLTLTDGNVTATRYIDVRSARFTKVDAETANDSRLFNMVSAFDLDADGSEEYLASWNGFQSNKVAKIYEQKTDGSFGAINKLYNNNLQLGQNVYPVDINRDGLVDFFTSGYYSSDYYIVNNNGSKSLSVSDLLTPMWNGKRIELKHVADFDNDGCLEAIFINSNGYIYYYAELGDLKDGITFENVKTLGDAAVWNVFDFNFDGLLDLDINTSGKRCIYLNDGNGNFTYDSELPKLNNSYPALIGDFDGDHKVDYAYNSSNYSFGVSTYAESVVFQFGNGRTVIVESPLEYAFSSFESFSDYDNNGMTDFKVSLGSVNFYDAFIYFHPDYSYDVRIENTELSNSICFHSNDGTTYYGQNILCTGVNSAPSKPSGLRASVSGGYLNIEWNEATDAETPSGSLCYNISVKHKGKEGEGAYLLSPMNLGRDNITVPYNHKLLLAPRIKIPLSSIPAGDYEVQVQAVDGMRLSGAFSDVLTVNVPESAILDCRTSTYVNVPFNITLLGNVDGSAIDFGQDAEVNISGKLCTVTWTTSGVKGITTNGQTLATVLVKERPEVDFELPSTILAGATVMVNCPTASQGKWYVVEGSNAVQIHESKSVDKVSVTDDAIAFTVKTTADFTLRHAIDDESVSLNCDRTSRIDSDRACPEIKMVSVSDKNIVHWSASSLPSQSQGVNIYRETSRLNVYELIGNTDNSTEAFTDIQSNPLIKTDRYRITAVLPYGESAPSVEHQPIHLQINKGLNGAVNLMWSKYEGMDVDTYIIYAGDVADDLRVVDQVSGNKSSYTVMSPQACYAVGLTPSTAVRSRAIADDMAISNVAYSADASNALLVSSIEIAPTLGSKIVDLASTGSLQLKAVLVPAGSSYTQVDWSIVSGQDIASVDRNGVVTATAPGKITVEATTRDGSMLSTTIELEAKRIEVPVTWLEFVTWPKDYELEVGSVFQYSVKIEPLKNTDALVWESSNQNVASISPDGIVTALRPGKATISLKSSLDPNMFIDLPLTVWGDDSDVVKVESLEITPKPVSGAPGSKIQMEVKISPENATDKSLTWEIYPYNSPVATVDANGLVTILEDGDARLVVYTMDGSDLTVIVPIYGSSGIDEILADGKVADVYSLGGVLIKKDASAAEIERLEPGVYIVNNQKVLIGPKK